MQEIIKILIGILVLIAGIPIGIILAKLTKEELKQGQKWFKIILLISFIGGITGLIIKNDILLFSFLFMAIICWGSLRR
jgi:hypothetical protein